MKVPSFHDGLMTGLRVHDDKSAQVFLTDIEKRAHVLTLGGVTHLKCEDFRGGNIVFALEIRQGETVDIGDLEKLFDAPHRDAAAKYQSAHRNFLAERRRQIAAGAAMLVTISSSSGGTLIAFCTEARLAAE
jgi:hypothetical protein